MKRFAAVLSLALASCSLGGAPPPVLHTEVLVLSDTDNNNFFRRTDGVFLGVLPAGIFRFTVNPGDDIAEAYDIYPAQDIVDGSIYSSINFMPRCCSGVTTVAKLPAPAIGAELVPAPRLTSFVGLKTVLVVLTADGTLAGYQHGNLLWSRATAPGTATLLTVGNEVYLHAGDYRLVTVETGELGDALGCAPPGPLAKVAGTLWANCGGTLTPGGAAVPDSRPAVIDTGSSTLLAFPEGNVWKLSKATARRAFKIPAWTQPPALSVDGRTLFASFSGGIDAIDVASGKARLLAASPANASIAISRDGNFLYALAEGRFRTFRLTDGAQVATVPMPGTVIVRVVGG